MIVSAMRIRRITAAACREKFLSILPAIKEQARFAFRSEDPDRRAELISVSGTALAAGSAVR